MRMGRRNNNNNNNTIIGRSSAAALTSGIVFNLALVTICINYGGGGGGGVSNQAWAFHVPGRENHPSPRRRRRCQNGLLIPPEEEPLVLFATAPVPVNGEPTLSDGIILPAALGETTSNLDATTESSLQNDKNADHNNTKQENEAIILDDDVMSIFDIVAGRAATCLVESDLRRDAKEEYSNVISSSATNWINDATAFALQKAFDRMKLKLAEERKGLDRDEASAWIRWMKSTPTPLIVDLSRELREVANATIPDLDFVRIEQDRKEFLTRLGCRLLLLPSGASLTTPLWEPPASIIYGKLLYGGMTRYRRLISTGNSQRMPRKAGERTDFKVSAADNVPAWIQYGGAERMYESVDMGPAGVFEVILLPRGQTLPDKSFGDEMLVQNLMWKPQDIFGMVGTGNNNRTGADASSNGGDGNIDYVTGYTPISQSGKDRNDAFQADFQTSVGGLQKQIDAIVRRVLDGRVIRPADEEDNGAIDVRDETSTALASTAMESEELAALGLTPVRGLLLYGPPGTGKTLLARQIARALRARTPKIVSAPELLDRWVGGSEKLVRGLFAEAEAELAVCNGDATRSALHVIVIDEIDAVFRRRSSGEDSGEATRASVVNQILAKLDGIKQIGNILLIGMTNRRELLDEALLRPGRLEVQIEVPLPDKEGRREILQIHFEALRRKGRLSLPLCQAIDGVGPFNRKSSSSSSSSSSPGADDSAPTRIRKRDTFKRAISKAWSDASSVVKPTYDLAADSNTGGYSGADIAGLVRCAGSLALSRARRDGNGVDGLLITLEDVKQALKEVGPS